MNVTWMERNDTEKSPHQNRQNAQEPFSSNLHWDQLAEASEPRIVKKTKYGRWDVEEKENIY